MITSCRYSNGKDYSFYTVNTSIATGEVPGEWKEAVVTPILKKGDSQKKEKLWNKTFLLLLILLKKCKFCNLDLEHGLFETTTILDADFHCPEFYWIGSGFASVLCVKDWIKR